MFCQMWFRDQKYPVEVPVAWSRYLHGNGVHGHWHPEMFFGHLITCPIPEKVIHKVPDVVTMVANSCDRSYNALKVWNERPKKIKDFAICVKSMWSPFKDNTKALIEWIEINIAQGAKSIQMYVQTITPNIRKVFDHYEQLGLVEIFQMEWPGSVPTSASPWLQQWYYPNVTWIHSSFDHYAYNDCLYRNLYKFQYIALLDLDELLMPTQHKTWRGLFQDLKNNGNDPLDYSSIMFYHLYFFGNKTGQSQTGHAMMDSDLRTAIPIPQAWQIKGFFNTQRNLIVFNHYTIDCITRSCETYHVDLSMGQLNHYRSDCVKVSIITPEICSTMKNTLTQDTLTKRYEDPVALNVFRTLQTIDFDPIYEG
ncbi:hypothetical protein TCAL_13748 [Tigriopus californicus]|uniref:Glycosyltransferase family 92 protein n=2 Tax=Tigriopus californicus TaxID=6832 RepID=A0A553PU06_TIGCA|nr:hypothetical protein TCAL_13748 [Tigriopus californicus]